MKIGPFVILREDGSYAPSRLPRAVRDELVDLRLSENDLHFENVRLRYELDRALRSHPTDPIHSKEDR